ncbi:MAG: RIP metalloprotease RseP [Rubrivivax sp.]
MITVLAFVVTLGILIVIHEWGHYRMALACGVKVERFSVGFGKPLLRWQRGETEFVVAAIPLGGYVKMLDEREGPVATSDLDRAFNRKSLRQRSAIVLAGPLANLVLAVLLYAVVGYVGKLEPRAVLATPPTASLAEKAGLQAGDWVQAVRRDGASESIPVRSLPDLHWHVLRAALDGDRLVLDVSDRDGRGPRSLTLDLAQIPPREVDEGLVRRVGLAMPFDEPVLGRVVADGPAARAGAQVGDRVLSVDGVAMADAQALFSRIRGSVVAGQAPPQLWLIERAGRRLELTVTPRVVAADGASVARIDAYIGRGADRIKVSHGLLESAVIGFERTWEMAALTLKTLGRMLIGEASLKNLSGPITIADVAGQAAQSGAVPFLEFLAFVSLSLGVLNLLPLPMLDGGHLMLYIFEAVRGRPPSDLWLARLQRGGLAVLLLMMSVALYNDVARIFGLS